MSVLRLWWVASPIGPIELQGVVECPPYPATHASVAASGRQRKLSDLYVQVKIIGPIRGVDNSNAAADNTAVLITSTHRPVGYTREGVSLQASRGCFKMTTAPCGLCLGVADCCGPGGCDHSRQRYSGCEYVYREGNPGERLLPVQ